MTPDEIIARVGKIDALKGDDECAHMEEDQLHQDLLRYLAVEGNELARLALLTTEIQFSRWYA